MAKPDKKPRGSYPGPHVRGEVRAEPAPASTLPSDAAVLQFYHEKARADQLEKWYRRGALAVVLAGVLLGAGILVGLAGWPGLGLGLVPVATSSLTLLAGGGLAVQLIRQSAECRREGQAFASILSALCLLHDARAYLSQHQYLDYGVRIALKEPVGFVLPAPSSAGDEGQPQDRQRAAVVAGSDQGKEN